MCCRNGSSSAFDGHECPSNGMSSSFLGASRLRHKWQLHINDKKIGDMDCLQDQDQDQVEADGQDQRRYQREYHRRTASGRVTSLEDRE